MGAYVNLGSFYLAGIPTAIVCGFLFHLQGKGLWIGLNVGNVLQSLLLSIITSFTDWKKQVQNLFVSVYLFDLEHDMKFKKKKIFFFGIL